MLPHLAARFGALTYRQGSAQDVHKLQTYRILDGFDTVNAEDEIAGTYRGLSIRIVELRLHAGSGNDRKNVFDGLLVDLVLPRSLTGTTAVIADAGPVGKPRGAMALRQVAARAARGSDLRGALRGVRHRSDRGPSAAHAGLHATLHGSRGALGFCPPRCLGRGQPPRDRLAKAKPVDLFEPPVYWKPAGGKALVALSQDIEAVLKMADAVIDLDFWASGRAS